MDICHLKNAELEAKHQKYKGRVVLRGDIVTDDSGSYAIFTEQGSSASQMTAAKIMDIISRLPGCDGQAADAVSAKTQVRWKMLTNCFKKSKIGVSRHLDSSTTTQMAKIMVQYWRPSRSSRKGSVRSSSGRTIMGKAIWENPIETWLGENSKLWMSLCTSWKRTILISVCGRCQTGRQNRKHRTDLENSHGRRWLGRTNIISSPCVFGLHSKRVPSQQRYCGELQRYVRIQDVCWSQGTSTNQSFREIWCNNNIFLVLLHGRSRK